MSMKLIIKLHQDQQGVRENYTKLFGGLDILFVGNCFIVRANYQKHTL